MEKVTITRLSVQDKNKEGVEYKTKKGEKFKRVSILTDKYPDTWFTCLAFSQEDSVMKLEEGWEGSLILEKGEFNNFKLPSRLDVLETRLGLVERQLDQLMNKDIKSDGKEAPVEEDVPDITEDAPQGW